MNRKRQKEIEKVCIKAGLTSDFRVSLGQNGHYIIDSPHLTRIIRCAGTPSDFRADLQLKSEVRKNLTEEYKNRKRPKTNFTDQEKAEIVKIALEENNHKKTAKRFSVGYSTLKKWCVDYRREQGETIVAGFRQVGVQRTAFLV